MESALTPDPIPELCAILVGASADWPAGEAGERLRHAARSHRVDRLVAWRTRHIDDDLRADALLDALRVRELNRVLAALERRGVRSIVFKGAALAHTHYEASWLRPRLDADLLIPSGQRQLAFDVLAELGYWQPPLISGDLVTYQTQFVRADITAVEHVLDVHWRVADPHVVADLVSYDELASRAHRVYVGGQLMRTPAGVDGLLLACVHRAVHHHDADDLLWIYDIHLVAGRFTAADWPEFLQRAFEKGVRALCARGVQRSVECFETPVPADVLAKLTEAGRPRERSAVYLRRDLRRVDRLIVDLRALGFRAGLRLMWEHVVPPADYVGRKYRVRNRALLPALYVRRVVEGTGKWLAYVSAGR